MRIENNLHDSPEDKDVYRKLECKSEVHKFNDQKEELSRLLRENEDYNKEMAAKRVKQRNLQVRLDRMHK